MRNALIVFKKEFYRVVSDRRLLIMSIFFPGLMIFMMYSLMGNVMENETQDVAMHEMVIYHENIPDVILNELNSIKEFSDLDGNGEIDYTSEYELVPIDLHLASELSAEEIEEKILAGEIDLLIVFPEEFEATLSNYEQEDYVIPRIEIAYNPGENYSQNTYNNINGILSQFVNAELNTRFGEDMQVVDYNHTYIVNEEKAQGQAFAMLLPMLIIMFLFSGAMNIGPDSIAGEKERGTIATLLVTPVKRFEIAIGKVMSLSVISLMSATSSFVGIIFGLRNLAGAEGGELNASIYGMNDYLMIIAVLFASVLVIVGIIAVISTYARTIKEAGMLILPFYFISIIVGVSSMFSGEAATSTALYLIPLYNSVNMLISILTFEVVPMHFILMVTSSVVYVTILIFIMNKLFQNEKVMFSK